MERKRKMTEKFETAHKHNSSELKGKSRKMINIREEKGSITVFVLAAMLFMLISLVLGYMSISNKNFSQAKDVTRIQKEYEVTEDQMRKIYEQAKDNNIY